MSRSADFDKWREKVVSGMPGAIRTRVQAGVDQNAQEFADRLTTNVPKESGELATTIRIEDGPRELSKTVSIGGPDHPYAAALEFGHMDHGKHVPANPYFFPLLRVLRKRLRGRMTRAIKTAVRDFCAESDGDTSGGDA